MTRFLIYLILVVSAPFTIIATPTTSPPTFIAYWGQSKSSNLFTDPNLTELTLSQLCQTTKFTQVHLAYLRDPLSLDELPGIDFSKHCTFPTNAYSTQYKSMRPDSGFAVLYCPTIGQGIRDCQALGKQVVLTISPVTAIANDAKATEFANNVWNLFFGGTSTVRPFGSPILNGIEIALRSDQYQGYVTFAQRLKQLSGGQNGQSQLKIIVSPRCEFPDALLGPTYPNRLLSATGGAISSIDAINVHFLASITCSLNGNPAGFQNAFQVWADFARSAGKPMYMTLPGFGYGYEAYFDAMEGDFANPQQLLTPEFWVLMNQYSDSFKGFGLFDASTDHWSHPCKSLTLPESTDMLASTTQYSDLLWWAISRIGSNRSFSGAECIQATQKLGGASSNPPETESQSVLNNANNGADFNPIYSNAGRGFYTFQTHTVLVWVLVVVTLLTFGHVLEI